MNQIERRPRWEVHPVGRVVQMGRQAKYVEKRPRYFKQRTETRCRCADPLKKRHRDLVNVARNNCYSNTCCYCNYFLDKCCLAGQVLSCMLDHYCLAEQLLSSFCNFCGWHSHEPCSTCESWPTSQIAILVQFVKYDTENTKYDTLNVTHKMWTT